MNKLDMLKVYVDCKNGDDLCDGSTPSKSVKTIDRAFEYVDDGYKNLDIKLYSSGDYYVTQSRLAGFSLHITGVQDNTTIHFINGCALYSIHVNWKNIKVVCDDDSVPYQDGGYCLFNTVNFYNGYTSNGGSCTLLSCSAPNISMNRTNFRINNLTVNEEQKTSITSVISAFYGSIGEVQGELNILKLKKDITYLININNSFVSLLHTINDGQKNKPKYCVSAYQSIVTSTASIYKKLEAYSKNGNKLKQPYNWIT